MMNNFIRNAWKTALVLSLVGATTMCSSGDSSSLDGKMSHDLGFIDAGDSSSGDGGPVDGDAARDTLGNDAKVGAEAGPLRADGTANDALPPADSQPTKFRFVALADTHLYNHERHPPSLQKFSEMLQHAKTLAADFVVVLGDVCGEDQPALAQAKDVAVASGIAVHFQRGNHDRLAEFTAAMGPPDYFFDHKGWRFVSLDYLVRLTRTMPVAISEAPPGSPIIVLRHYEPDIYGGPPLEAEVLLEYDVRLFLAGHVHVFSLNTFDDKLQVVTGAPFSSSAYNYLIVDVQANGRIDVSTHLL